MVDDQGKLKSLATHLTCLGAWHGLLPNHSRYSLEQDFHHPRAVKPCDSYAGGRIHVCLAGNACSLRICYDMNGVRMCTVY